jgi:hypothetical protein
MNIIVEGAMPILNTWFWGTMSREHARLAPVKKWRKLCHLAGLSAKEMAVPPSPLLPVPHVADVRRQVAPVADKCL